MMQYYGQNQVPCSAGRNPFVPNWQNPAETLEKRRLRKQMNRMGWALVAFEVFSFPLAILFRLISSIFRMGDGESLFVDGSLEYELASMAMYILMMTIPFLVYALFVRVDLRQIPFSRPKGKAFYLGVPVAMAVCVLGNYVSGLFASFMQLFGLRTEIPDTVVPESWVGRIVFLVSLSIIPALAEELVFRGIIMQPLRRWGDHFAVLVSAALFGLMHGNFNQIPFAFVVGLIIGFMVIKTGTLWTGIVIHFFNNFFSGVLSIVDEHVSDRASQLISAGYFVLLLAAGLLCLIFLLKAFPDFFRLRRDPQMLSLQQKTACAIGNPGMIAAVCLFLGLAVLYIKPIG